MSRAHYNVSGSFRSPKGILFIAVCAELSCEFFLILWLEGRFPAPPQCFKSREVVCVPQGVDLVLHARKWVPARNLGCVESVEVHSKKESAILFADEQYWASPL